MKKKVSLKDIAEKVGVSTALVSYVLNGKKTDRISKEVAQKIKDAALQLNYRTNHIARSLKTNKTSTIGLIVSDIANSFSSSLARIIEDEAEKNNYTVLFGSSDENAEKSQKLVDVLINHQVDGLIIAAAENSQAQIEYLQASEIPFVLIDRYFPEINATHIAIDNFKAAYNAVQHLHKNGFQRVGLITYKTTLHNLQERKNGYLAALKENKTRNKKSWVREVSGGDQKKQVVAAIDQLLSLTEPIEAIVFASNVLSIYGLSYINTSNMKVPNDLAIVSFDESVACELFYSSITHIKQPINEMARSAFRLLLASIDKNNKITKINMEAELVIGQSSLRRTT